MKQQSLPTIRRNKKNHNLDYQKTLMSTNHFSSLLRKYKIPVNRDKSYKSKYYRYMTEPSDIYRKYMNRLQIEQDRKINIENHKFLISIYQSDHIYLFDKLKEE